MARPNSQHLCPFPHVLLTLWDRAYCVSGDREVDAQFPGQHQGKHGRFAPHKRLGGYSARVSPLPRACPACFSSSKSPAVFLWSAKACSLFMSSMALFSSDTLATRDSARGGGAVRRWPWRRLLRSYGREESKPATAYYQHYTTPPRTGAKPGHEDPWEGRVRATTTARGKGRARVWIVGGIGARISRLASAARGRWPVRPVERASRRAPKRIVARRAPRWRDRRWGIPPRSPW